jgi:hypothetical protein|eukprot:scaffold2161_cov212-Alexandrium_tamarense.AAC.41
MNDSLFETRRAQLLLRGWTSATESYGEDMRSVGLGCIDEKLGVPVVEERRKKKMLEGMMSPDKSSGAGAAAESAGSSTSFSATQQPRSPQQKQASQFSSSEKCGAMIQSLADSATQIAQQYEEMVLFIKKEVLPELSS